MSTRVDRDGDDARMIEAMERALPRVAPPDDLFDRILDEVRAEAVVVPLHSRRRRPPTAWIGTAAAAAAAIVLIAVIATRDAPGSPTARAVIASPTDPSVSGEATLFEESGTVLVSLQSVPKAPSGHHYEVWVLPEGSEAMISVGTFHADGGDVRLELPLPGKGLYAAVDVSVEEDAGPATHSDTSYGSGAFV